MLFKVGENLFMKKKFLIFLIILNFISIIISVLNYISISNEILLLSTCIIACTLVLLFVKWKILLNIDFELKKVVFSIVLSFLFCIMLPLKFCLNSIYFCNYIPLINLIIKILFTISLFFSMFVIMILLFSCNLKQSKYSNKTKLIMKIAVFAIGLCFIISTSTGFYDYDFQSIWSHEVDGWTNWHTFAFSFFVYIIKIIFGNSYPIIILNFALFVYFFNYATDLIDKYINKKSVLYLFFFLTLFSVVCFEQLRYIKKDVLFALGFCNLILTFFDYLNSKNLSIKIILKMFFFSIITSLFRHGGILLTTFFFIVFLTSLIINKKFKQIFYPIILIGINIGLYLLLNYIGFNILNGFTHPKNVTYTVPIYQVGAFANNGYEFSYEEKKYLSKYLSVDYMKDHFVKYSGDTLARVYTGDFNNFNYSKLISLNYKLLKDNPIYYVRSLLDLTNILWKIEKEPSEMQIFFYKLNPSELLDEYKDITLKWQESRFNIVVDFIVNICLKSVLFNLRVRGGLPLFMIFISICLLIYKKVYIYLLPVCVILFWELCLFLSLPVGMTRYILPFINIYPFLFCFSLGIDKNVN